MEIEDFGFKIENIKMSLRERLDEILPTLLPADEAEAIKGRELIARVRAVLGEAYSDHTLRSQFSFMVLDPASCLARVENGQGYYLRRPGDEDSLQNLFRDGAAGLRESSNLYHKALALAVRLYDTAGMGVFVYPPEEEESWERPDLVAVQWPAGCVEPDGAYVIEDTEAEPTFRAVTVALCDTAEDARRAFYRALACGLWAEESELLLLPGAEAPEELAHLAARFGVGIRCVEADAELLEQLPRADELFRMDNAAARALLADIASPTLAHPRLRRRCETDADDLPATVVVRQWAKHCVSRGRIEACEQRVAVN